MKIDKMAKHPRQGVDLPRRRWRVMNVIKPTIAEKVQIAEECMAFRGRLKEISAQTKLSTSAIKNWIHRHKIGQKFYEKGGGRRFISDDQLTKVKAAITVAAEGGDGMSRGDTEKLLKASADTPGFNGRTGIAKTICKRSISNYYSRLQLVEKTAEYKTETRFQAENDIKNAVSQVVMWHSVLQLVSGASNIINYDATQYGWNDSRKKPTVMVGRSFKMEGAKPLSTVAAKTTVDPDFFIKYFCIVTASGELYPNHVFVLADAKLKPGEMHHYTVKGLGTTALEHGHIVFCETRSGNQAFFEWLTCKILLEWIKRLGSAHDGVFFLNCDGEAPQIAPFMNEENLRTFSESNVIVGKISAACTAVAQACDAGNLFKATKKKLEGLDEQLQYDSPNLRVAIETALNAHETLVHHELNYKHRQKMLSGLQAVRYCINNVMKPELIQKSFEKIGISRNATLDIEGMLKCFNVIMTNGEYMDFMDALPRLSKKFMKEGRLLDSDMDTLVAVTNTGGVHLVRDDKVEYQQRSLLLNHRDTVARYIGRKEKQAAENEAAEKRKEVRAAKKVAKQGPDALAPPKGPVKRRPSKPRKERERDIESALG
jgi:2C-methyl-D-erythritol 2,4-cyclodiphosphate synthase